MIPRFLAVTGTLPNRISVPLSHQIKIQNFVGYHFKRESFKSFSSSSISLTDDHRSNSPTSGEELIITTLRKAFPTATDMAVVDVSGGCGSMYEVFVESPDFAGLRVVKQHQLVTAALKKEISDMHGIRISTQASCR